MKKINKLKHRELLNIGFALLIPGMALAAVLDVNRQLQVVGIILLLISSAVFGASIKTKDN